MAEGNCEQPVNWRHKPGTFQAIYAFKQGGGWLVVIAHSLLDFILCLLKAECLTLVACLSLVIVNAHNVSKLDLISKKTEPRILA